MVESQQNRRVFEAAQELGIEPGADIETVKRAYSKAIKRAHPDSGGDPSKAADQIQNLKAARDTLIGAKFSETLKAQHKVCESCHGQGVVQVGFQGIPCPSCKGRG